MRFLIAGGSALIGRRLCHAWVTEGHHVTVLTRNPDRARRRLPVGVTLVAWNPGRTASAADPTLVDALRGMETVVNLAGASIGGWPWTPRRKRAILESRLAVTNAIVDAIAVLPAGERPHTLINASGIDVYGDRRDREIDEESPPGDTFLGRVAVAWEAAARRAEELEVRVVLCRQALVVARDALAFRLLVLPFRLFVGGRLGSGEQPFTWIHLDDVVGLYGRAARDSSISGALNLVAPEVLPERDVARIIGRVLGRPAWFPAPAALLRVLLWGQADLLLHGRHAVPARAIAAGYRFRFTTLEPAVRDALGRPLPAVRPAHR